MKLPLKKNLSTLLVLIFIVTLLYLLPNSYYQNKENAIRCRGEILNTDNSNVSRFGIVKKGSQLVEIKLLDNRFKGNKVEATNQLLGQMDRDKFFKKGDIALVVLSLDEKDNIAFVNPQAHYRIGNQIFLLIIFAAGLVAFGGWTGIRSLFSFIISALVIWKILVPSFLNGYSPILTGFLVVTLLCAVIIFLVAGFNKKGVTAFTGALLGILTSCLLAVGFAGRFHIHGAVMPFAETLLYSGYGHLDITGVYIAGVFICAAGAVMDLAMDVAASMEELFIKNPKIRSAELFFSGLRISRTVVGTMTTTLLFAYSGGYITLLMAFMAQGIPPINMFNLIYVAAEILKTLIGSIGLIMVGPFTAVVGAFFLTYRKEQKAKFFSKLSWK